MIDYEELLKGFPIVGNENEYGRGWNDCYKAVRRVLEHKEGQWIKDGYVPLPKTQAEAEMMHLISENWLKNNVTSQSKEGDDA